METITLDCTLPPVHYFIEVGEIILQVDNANHPDDTAQLAGDLQALVAEIGGMELPPRARAAVDAIEQMAGNLAAMAEEMPEPQD